MSFEELMHDTQFLSRLYDAQDMNAVKALFDEVGLALTEEEIMAHILPNGTELEEEDLENVSGGTSRFNPFFGWLRSRGSSGGGHSSAKGRHG